MILKVCSALLAFLLGSIPFGYLIVKFGKSDDVRTHGSGNIGATNVVRVAGPSAGILTLLLDAAKGYASVAIAGAMSGHSTRWMMLAAVLAVAGHVFTPWLGFRGGKGVATAMGALLPISASAVIAAILVWLLVIIFWRYVALGSVAAAATVPVSMYLLYERGFAPPLPVTLGTICISLFVIIRHKGNLERILKGEEHRLFSSE